MKSRKRAKRSLVLTTLLLASLTALAAAGANPIVNINTADAKQLSLLPRIGLAVAQRIIDHRKQNGPFKSTDELMLVRGIGEKVYAQLKPYVATSGETTLVEKVASAGRSGKDKASSRTPRVGRARGKTPPPAAKDSPAAKGKPAAGGRG